MYVSSPPVKSEPLKMWCVDNRLRRRPHCTHTNIRTQASHPGTNGPWEQHHEDDGTADDVDTSIIGLLLSLLNALRHVADGIAQWADQSIDIFVRGLRQCCMYVVVLRSIVHIGLHIGTFGTQSLRAHISVGEFSGAHTTLCQQRQQRIRIISVVVVGAIVRCGNVRV